MKTYAQKVVFALLGLFIACGNEEEYEESIPSETYAEFTMQAASASSEQSARMRIVWEAARAMVGPEKASDYRWQENITIAQVPYIAEDIGAWNAVRRSYRTPGYVSCRDDPHSSPCYVYYGSEVVSRYACQGSCPRNPSYNFRFRGGQCKAFINLVAYRSGMYHGANWSFKTLPADASAMMRNQPYATPYTIRFGDILRRPNGHALLIVRVLDNGRRAIVFDSNWIYGDGQETVGSHVMSFTGSGNNNLGNYRIMHCVYNGQC